ncbi:MAG: Rap1a/Tai family immunity protein [Micropepsaceae bacterium]
MRFVILILASLAMAAPAAADGFPDGRSLSNACQALRDATADGSKAPSNDPCRSWLFGFFTAYKEDYDARFAAFLSGATIQGDTRPCFRPPDFISFVDVAGLVVAQSKARPELLDAPPELLVLESMAAAYPCEAPDNAAAP